MSRRRLRPGARVRLMAGFTTTMGNVVAPGLRGVLSDNEPMEDMDGRLWWWVRVDARGVAGWWCPVDSLAVTRRGHYGS